MCAILSFRVGQEVVCITDVFEKRYGNQYLVPIKGKVYTIFGIHSSSIYASADGGIGFLLVELPEMGRHWGAAGFRPVKKVKTDISIFTAMLVPTPAPLNPVEVA